jgi:hypothetical protein
MAIQPAHRPVSALLAAAVLGGSGLADAQPAPEPVFAVSAVIAQVKRELAAAQNAPGAALVLRLEKAEATLAVSRVVDANGKVSVGVPSLGLDLGGSGGRKAEQSSTLFVELAPPRAGAALGATETWNLGLAEAIVDARRELLKGLADEPKLEPRKVVITIRFGVTRTAGGSGQLQLVLLTLGGGATTTTTDLSTVVLTFAAAPPRSATARSSGAP